MMNMAFGTFYAISAFMLPLEQEFGWTRAQTSWVPTIGFVMIATWYVIAGRIHDRLVNLLVQPEVIGKFAPQIVRIHFEMQRFDFRDLRIGDAGASHAARHEIQAGNDLEEVADVCFRKLPHPRAAVRQQIDQPLRCQYFQRLTQGRARNSVFLAQVPFRNPRAGDVDRQIQRRAGDQKPSRLRVSRKPGSEKEDRGDRDGQRAGQSVRCRGQRTGQKRHKGGETARVPPPLRERPEGLEISPCYSRRP